MSSNWLERRKGWAAALLALASLLAAWTTELLSQVPGAGLSIWLPTGFLFAIAVITARRYWPLWAAAAAAAEFAGNMLWYQHRMPPAILFVSGNVLAGLVGAYLFQQARSGRYRIAKLAPMTRFLLIAAVAMPAISSVLVSIALGWSYGRPLFASWPRIFLGDATGNVIAAPLALLFLGAAAPLPRLRRSRQIELLLLIAIFLALAALSLGGFLPLAFIMITPMLWAAFRFRVAGAIIASVGLTIIGAFLTATEISPFAQSANYGDYGHYGLQLFLLVAASTALLVGAVSEENRQAMLSLRSSNLSLGQQADERAAQLAASEARARETGQLLAAISEASPDLIFAKDRNFRLIYANPATLNIYGANRLAELGELQEAQHYAVDADGDAIRRVDERLFETGRTQIAEERVIYPDGTLRIYRSTKAPLFDAAGELVGLAGVSVDITEAKRSAEREQMLVREIQHRARNLLAVVQGIVQLTRASNVGEFKKALAQRIQALARSNDALAASAWNGASLSRIIEAELAPYQGGKAGRVRCKGPDILLDTGTAQSLALVVHELATNAAKYGALSSEHGRVTIRWDIATLADGERQLHLIWKERGGPAVTPPSRQGFGSTVIAMFGEENPGDTVRFDWHEAGLEVSVVRRLSILPSH